MNYYYHSLLMVSMFTSTFVHATCSFSNLEAQSLVFTL